MLNIRSYYENYIFNTKDTCINTLKITLFSRVPISVEWAEKAHS